MNKDALLNLALKLVTYAAGAATAHGILTNSGREWCIAGVAAVLTWVGSHWHVSSMSGLPAGQAGNGKSGSGSALPLLTLFCALTLCLLPGCAGTGTTTVFNSEQLAADLGTAGVHAFNQYYAVASTSTTNAGTLANLAAARAQVYEASTKLAATLSVAENLRQNFPTNAAATNMLQAVVDDCLSEASNLVWTVQYLMSSPGTNSVTLPGFSALPAAPAPPNSTKLLQQLVK